MFRTLHCSAEYFVTFTFFGGFGTVMPDLHCSSFGGYTTSVSRSEYRYVFPEYVFKFSSAVSDYLFFTASAMRSSNTRFTSSGLSPPKSTHVSSSISPSSAVPRLLQNTDSPNSAATFQCLSSSSLLSSVAGVLLISISTPYFSHASINNSLLLHLIVSKNWRSIIGLKTVFRALSAQHLLLQDFSVHFFLGLIQSNFFRT